MKVNNNHIAFLKEYEKLCNKYKMGIDGCGCCGSAFLTDWTSGNFEYSNDLKYINYEYSEKRVLINDKTIDELEKEVEVC